MPSLKTIIGFAVALQYGKMIVPEVNQVEFLGFVAVARQIDALIKKAQSGRLTGDERSGGSFILSNIGSFDNLRGTSIIVQPQVAI
jgi:2-oxoglutarate dehydrogenase E2 component (dihydrolipoamide succinyltransferase)